MEIKTTLPKPYSDKQRLDFIVLNNHVLGYEIQETASSLEAWGYTQEEIEEQNKQQRNAEIDSKIKELEQESVKEILYGNEENIKVYQDVINGLIATKNSLEDI